MYIDCEEDVLTITPSQFSSLSWPVFELSIIAFNLIKRPVFTDVQMTFVFFIFVSCFSTAARMF